MHLPGFDGWTFIDKQETDYDIKLKAVAPYTLAACPNCSSPDQFFRHGRREQFFMDTPMLGKRVGLLIQRQRYRCATCNQVFFQPLPEMDEKRVATRRLIEFIRRQAIKRPFLSVSEDVGLDEKTIRNIFADYIEEMDHKVHWDNSEWIGLDEVHVGGAFRCVVTDIKERCLIDLLPNRYFSTLSDAFFNKAIKKVDVVCMDMHDPYRKAVELWLPGATIVADKFHVMQLVSEALVKVRKAVGRTLSKKQRDTLRAESAELLLVNRHQLDPMQQVRRDEWLSNFADLRTAYDLKEEFADIYLVNKKQGAWQRYLTWKQKVMSVGTTPFTDVVRAIDKWLNEFLNYFDFPQVTNAYTESINNRIKLANLIGRGYSFDVLRGKCLYAEGHFKIRMPKFEKQWKSTSTPDSLAMTGGWNQAPLEFVVVEVPFETLIKEFGEQEEF
ncbi:MAG TPA: ISL3 family transposase [Blastocatellia bacterium]|jgi:transposase